MGHPRGMGPFHAFVKGQLGGLELELGTPFPFFGQDFFMFCLINQLDSNTYPHCNKDKHVFHFVTTFMGSEYTIIYVIILLTD